VISTKGFGSGQFSNDAEVFPYRWVSTRFFLSKQLYPPFFDRTFNLFSGHVIFFAPEVLFLCLPLLRRSSFGFSLLPPRRAAPPWNAGPPLAESNVGFMNTSEEATRLEFSLDPDLVGNAKILQFLKSTSLRVPVLRNFLVH